MAIYFFGFFLIIVTTSNFSLLLLVMIVEKMLGATISRTIDTFLFYFLTLSFSFFSNKPVYRFYISTRFESRCKKFRLRICEKLYPSSICCFLRNVCQCVPKKVKTIIDSISGRFKNVDLAFDIVTV